MPIPDTIAGAPQLREDLRWLWEAFSDLTTERPPSGGMGGPPGHIPWRAMHAYCAAHGIRGVHERSFVDVLKAMDDVYLEHACKKLKKDAPNVDPG